MKSVRLPLLLVVLVFMGCGGGDDDASGGSSSAATPAATATPAPGATKHGVTSALMAGLPLGTPRAKALKRLPEPLRAFTQKHGTEHCYEFQTLDDGGRPLPGQSYRVCFDRKDRLALNTTQYKAP